jgi:hypothetical protein
MNRLVPISVAVSLPLLSALAFGQEYKREWLPRDVRETDLIAVGTLSGVWTYPWLDGWHRRGTINVERVLFQSRPFGNTITLAWGRLYGRSFSHPDWAKYDGQRGIWILKEYTTTWDDRLNIWCGNGMENVAKTQLLKAPWTKGFAGGLLGLETYSEVVNLIERLP